MQNEFEKQVREKMEELSFTPSAPVWQKLEAQIRKKKEQRRIFFFLIPFFILATAFLIWQWNGHDKKANTPAHSSLSENPSLQSKAHTNDVLVDQFPVKNIRKNESGRKVSIINKGAVLNQLFSGQKNIQFYAPQSQMVYDSKEIKKITIEEASKNVTEEDQATLVSNKEMMVRASLREDARIDSHLLHQPVMIIKPDAKAAIQFVIVSDSNKTAQVPPTQKKWQKNYTIEIGRSYYGTGLSMDKSYNNLASVPATSTGGSANLPSKINKGFSFALGAGVKKMLSAKINFNAGLLYHYYSTVMRTGIHHDSTIFTASGNVRSYYANTNASKYTNRFHTIEIPLSIEYQPAAHIPLQIAGGVSYGYLLATNALHYDAGADVYYRDKKEFFHSALNIFSSVQYRFRAGKKTQIQTGPQFSYNAIATQRHYNSSTPHLYFFGLATNIIF